MKLVLILFILPLLVLSCNEHSNPVYPPTSNPRFTVDTLNIIANPDSVHAKIVYHFEGSPGFISSFLVEVYFTGHLLAYGIHPNYPVDSVSHYYTKYSEFSLYYTPAVGYTTYAKCVLTGSYVDLTDTGWIESEKFTWSDSSDITISQ